MVLLSISNSEKMCAGIEALLQSGASEKLTRTLESNASGSASFPDPSQTGTRVIIGESDETLPALVQDFDPDPLTSLGLIIPVVPKLTLSLGPPLPVFTRYNMDDLPTRGHRVLGTTILYVPSQQRAYNVIMDTKKHDASWLGWR